MPESKFIRLSETETRALDRVLVRICAGNDHAEAVVLQRILDRLRKVWRQPSKRRRLAAMPPDNYNHGAPR